MERGLDWDLTGLPVPVDLLVYTLAEWQEMAERETGFYKTIVGEVVWVYPEEG
jgi:hypothetical protein